MTSKYYIKYHKNQPRNRAKPPETNFFSVSKDRHYKKLLDRTKEIASAAIHIASLTEEDIQRSPLNQEFFFG
jgi:hypothetical protein